MDIVLIALVFPLLGLLGAAFREMNEREFEEKLLKNAKFRIYLVKQLVIGAIAGAFMMVTLIGIPVNAGSLISAFSVGYVGSSFVENFIARRVPKTLTEEPIPPPE